MRMKLGLSILGLVLSASSAAQAGTVRAYAGVVAGEVRIGELGPFSCATSGPTIGGGWFAGLVLPTEGIAACGLAGGVDDRIAAAGPQNAGFSASGPMAPPGAGYSGSAQASADYWRLGVAASGVADGLLNSAIYHQSHAFASFSLPVTLAKPGIAPGTPGTVDFSFLLEGLVTSSAVAPFSQQADVSLGLRVNGTFIWDIFRATVVGNGLPFVRGGASGLPGAFTLAPGSLSGSALLTSTAGFAIQWGVPFELEVAMIANVYPCCGGAQMEVDFLNTATLAGIGATAAGQAVSGFTVLTASGPEVGPAGVVPEPAAGLLMLLGVGGLLWARRR